MKRIIKHTHNIRHSQTPSTYEVMDYHQVEYFVYNWFYTGNTVYGHCLDIDGHYHLITVHGFYPSCYVSSGDTSFSTVNPVNAEYKEMRSSRDISAVMPYYKLYFENTKQMKTFVSEAKQNYIKVHMAEDSIPQIAVFLSQRNLSYVGWCRLPHTHTHNSSCVSTTGVVGHTHTKYDIRQLTTTPTTSNTPSVCVTPADSHNIRQQVTRSVGVRSDVVSKLSAEDIFPSNNIVPYNYPTVMAFDIEVKCSALGMPQPHKIEDTVEMISVVLFENDIDSSSRSFIMHAYDQNMNIDGVADIMCNDEADLIIQFFELIKQKDPTIITGFNIYGFDLHYLVCRLQLRLTEIPDVSRGIAGNINLIKVDWTSDAYGHNNFNRLVIGGRLIVDMYLYFKRMKLDKYSLDFISNKFIGESKNDMPHGQMTDAFLSRDIEALRIVAKYCVQDSVLVMKLFHKVHMWIDSCEIAKITMCGIEDIYTRGEQMKLVAQCVKECMKREIILQYTKFEEWKQYEGAYVLDPERGVYEGCSIVDFQSLYPSIIIAYNICPSTHIHTHDIRQLTLGVRLASGVSDVQLESKYVSVVSDVCWNSDVVTADSLYHKIGSHYFRKKPVGLLPGMIKKLLDERKAVKKNMIKLDKTSVDYIVFDRRQNALKICANSIYGMMGFKNSKYFGNVACAESVTTVGRLLLTYIVKKIEQFYPVKVIYGDTDSCMLCHNDKLKDKVVKLAVQICDDVTALLPEPMALKFECHCEKIILFTKKRYVLVSDGKVSYKGVMNARRDYCKYAKDTYSGVIKLVVEGKTGDVTDYIDDKIIKLLQINKIPVSDLVVTKSIGRKLSTYKVNQPHIVLARRLSDKTGVEVPAGTRLEYVFTKENGMSTLSEFEEEGLQIDSMFYVRKQLATQIDDVLATIGVGYYIKNTWLA